MIDTAPLSACISMDACITGTSASTNCNRPLFLKPVRACDYVACGSSNTLNVSAEPAGTGAGVLIRA